jgi:hypothetical protein
MEQEGGQMAQDVTDYRVAEAFVKECHARGLSEEEAAGLLGHALAEAAGLADADLED